MNRQTLPRARNRALVVRELGDEVIVYDLDRHKAVCLNRVAALVWRSCNGRRSTGELAERVSRQLGEPIDEACVTFAVERLAKARLLDGKIELQAPSRREMLKRLGKTAAFALPFVLTMTVPLPAEAARSACAGCLVTTGQNCATAPGCGLGSVCGRNCNKTCKGSPPKCG